MQSTRQEILSILREEKQATVEDLAQRLELTPMTIRHHLNVLQAQNLVMASKVRRSKKVGRPRLVYTLTDAADELFPSGYGELARRLVSEVKETMGEEETRDLFRRIAADLAAEAPPPEKDQSFEDRLDQVSEFLEEQGFLSRWEKTDEGYVLTNVNCPYRRVSREHSEVCILDTELLERLLDVEPQRRESMRAGGTACSFLLKPNGS
ncbi:MAG: ArsR family transcriptional regulator [Anaerolineae bacterium]|jgi:DeoR family transcriptional regulator, suf operon transcriptional repressor